MTDVIKKWDVVDMLTALENDFQKYKPFQGNEEAMYRKVCEVEIAIGKMENIYTAGKENEMKQEGKVLEAMPREDLFEQAMIENNQMAEKIEMQENCIAALRAQIETQHDIIHGLELKAERLEDKVDEFGRERGVLKAQMEVVRLIFGGGNRG